MKFKKMNLQADGALQKVYFQLFEKGIISQESYLKALGHDYNDVLEEIKSMPTCHEDKLIVWSIE